VGVLWVLAVQKHPHMCVLSSGCPKFPDALHSHILLYVCMCVCVSHTLNFIQYSFVSVCLMQCSENLLCWALLLPSRIKRETEFLSAFPCFTASLHHCCCAALCSCALPRLPSLSCAADLSLYALTVKLQSVSVCLFCVLRSHCSHRSCAVVLCVSVLCAAVLLCHSVLLLMCSFCCVTKGK